MTAALIAGGLIVTGTLNALAPLFGFRKRGKQFEKFLKNMLPTEED
jgi:hypothetical protein